MKLLTMKRFSSFLISLLAVVILFASCSEDEQPAGQVVITGVPATSVLQPGEVLGPVTANIQASNGLSVLLIRKDGVTLESIEFDGEVSVTHEFSYSTTGEDANKNLVFEFVATDRSGVSQTVTHVLTVGAVPSAIRIAENITQDQTWETGKVYILGGRITVTNGATLTIQPGVVVKGEAGSGPNATALIIARGAKINAEGRADQPIIFTSIADEIQPGMVASPNLEPNLEGLWGGLIVLGNAPGSFAGDVSEVQIEGIPPSDNNGLYGGNDPEDSSGILKFISIRHGGANIGEGNEINGLTLGGVGSGTIIENIEVVANQDDGVEWFGGSVNVKNVLVWNSGDDALDTDQAWSGTMDNFIILCGANTDHALEIDGPEGSFNASHTLRNGTIKGHPAAEMADFRDGARGTFENLYFLGFSSPEPDGRGDFSLSGETTIANFQNDILRFSSLETTLPEGTALQDVFRNGTHIHASDVVAGANTVGADKNEFAGWSWAAVAGELDNL